MALRLFGRTTSSDSEVARELDAPMGEIEVGKGRSGMWLRLLWQLRELLPLLGRMLPLLEGWVAGNSGASAATQAALAKLESRVTSAVGTTQEDLGRQLRDQSQVLLHVHSELKQLRVVVERESMEREVLAEGLAQVRKGMKLLLAGVVVCAVLLAAVLIVLWLPRSR
jgi:hypothetical protein